MTVLALLGLAVAAGVSLAVTADDDAQRRADALALELESARRKIAELSSRIEEVEAEVQVNKWGHVSCLGTDPGSPQSPARLFRISVDGFGYRVAGGWTGNLNQAVNAIPFVKEAIRLGQMEDQEFQRYAKAIYDYGNRVDTFGASCRFFVDLKNNAEFSAYARAYGVVQKYFLFANSAEANAALAKPH